MSIELKGVNFFYGTQQSLFDINLFCPSGEKLVLLGPSGAGKSSLIRILNLLEIPRSGSLTIAQQSFDFTQPLNETEVRKLRKNVGMVFQQYNLWPHLTVLRNLIEAPCRVSAIPKEVAISDARQLLKRLNLEKFEMSYPLNLSGGQQQRVAIARALMMKPQVLLFDEPTAALDPQITAQFVDIVNEFSKTGITQVIVTHEVEVAKKTASHVVYMEHGKIIEHGDKTHFSQPTTSRFAQYLSNSF